MKDFYKNIAKPTKADKFEVWHNDVKLFSGTHNQCFSYILDHQPASVHHATTYEGWNIREAVI